MPESTLYYATLVVFVITYAGLAIGKVPGLRADRTTIALAGGAAVLALRLLTFDQATQAVDFSTIVLLLGMMIVVEFLRIAGFFEIVGGKFLTKIKKPHAMLAVVMTLSGILSAILVNDVVCLALTPLVIQVTRHLNFDPKPHLIGLAVASNVGSVATLTGNPQNMIIGVLSHISYLRFAAKLAPVAAICLVISYFITLFICRKQLIRNEVLDVSPSENTNEKTRKPNKKKLRLLIKSSIITLAAIVLFFCGFPMEIVAIAAASLLLLERVNSDKVFRMVDWNLLVMFAGLFIVVHAFEVHVMSHLGIQRWSIFNSSPVVFLSVVSAILSNIVSNVPAVLLFKEIIAGISSGSQETAWLALAMSSTLAGNFTVLGSVANLIVVENAQRSGVLISLLDYCKVGVLVTVVTLAVGIGWLCLVHY